VFRIHRRTRRRTSAGSLRKASCIQQWLNREDSRRDDVDDDPGGVCGRIDDHDIRLMEMGESYLVAVYG